MTRTDLTRKAAALLCTVLASATFLAAAVAPATHTNGARAAVAAARLTA